MDFTGSIINEFKSLPAFWWLWLIATFVSVWVIDGKKNIARSLLVTYILFILMETVIGRKTGIGQVELTPLLVLQPPRVKDGNHLELCVVHTTGIAALFVPWREIWSPCGNGRIPAIGFDRAHPDHLQNRCFRV